MVLDHARVLLPEDSTLLAWLMAADPALLTAAQDEAQLIRTRSFQQQQAALRAIGERARTDKARGERVPYAHGMRNVADAMKHFAISAMRAVYLDRGPSDSQPPCLQRLDREDQFLVDVLYLSCAYGDPPYPPDLRNLFIEGQDAFWRVQKQHRRRAFRFRYVLRRLSDYVSEHPGAAMYAGFRLPEAGQFLWLFREGMVALGGDRAFVHDWYANAVEAPSEDLSLFVPAATAAAAQEDPCS